MQPATNFLNSADGGRLTVDGNRNGTNWDIVKAFPYTVRRKPSAKHWNPFYCFRAAPSVQ